MNQLEKLQVLLPHWIEHNHGHAEECRKWAALVVQNESAEEVSLHLAAAFAAMETVGDCLEKALVAAGGAKKGDESGHHHHHHH
ncbi:MAG: hypothetical protein KKD01_13310 [Proteobacteria bacterium]|nr:hypothetical protein [Pseudomonadota bacterium]MBU1232666.1 hypothetical protein [Pseudomonadota bacterium]MBU1418879.1 hypothetical protein [Pseudomonadota bacterium]MBU1455697.1 hypothetical protein [Pseudomonadota bacterium]